MESIIKQEGYSFKKIESKRPERPYKVKCIETGEEKDSSISCDDAINLILAGINFKGETLVEKSKDKKYVKSIFEKFLKNKKLSEINKIVEDEITGRYIVGKIVAMERQLLDLNQVYFTEHYKITAVCEYARQRGITSILIEARQ